MRPLGPTLHPQVSCHCHIRRLPLLPPPHSAIFNSPPTFYEIVRARDSSRSLVQIVAYCCQTSPGSCQVRARCPCCAGGSTAISRTAPTAKTLSALRERVNAPLSTRDRNSRQPPSRCALNILAHHFRPVVCSPYPTSCTAITAPALLRQPPLYHRDTAADETTSNSASSLPPASFILRVRLSPDYRDRSPSPNPAPATTITSPPRLPCCLIRNRLSPAHPP